MTVEIGSFVRYYDGENSYTGKVIALKDAKACVRWHKGYSSWMTLDKLERVENAFEKTTVES